MRPFPPASLSKDNPREYRKLYMRAYSDRNPERVRRQRRMYLRWSHHLFRWQLLEEFGPCKRCGYADPRALQFDHVEGGGRKENAGRVPFYKSSYEKTRERLLNGEMQVLCSNCNWIKRSEQREVAQRLDS